ncbi:MAG: bifunctional phosphopantothenoylcysteine decarboxylase/phosphopantothenate--cysteine ligase CoaBC [Gracilibacteraceae bacterium]|jgi:phosphopantothenoylcysteine decarboxylase/phosphopantothenate--cysteine ligase|nr:bifunctional phosphopantothenoylcysteine decarboxylase/phosphopantothenate--cysteine ligase CoaBC [Gracilibacteraceae bacterium]
MLAGKHVVCGVCGGIAAYKAAALVSALAQKGCHVHVVMTRAATEFVAPLTFRSLSGNPVCVEMFAEPKIWKVEHVGLAEQADLTVVAPATANVLAKMATGLADDFLSTLLLAVRCPVFVAPAMNEAMFCHEATQHNLEVLRGRGVRIIGPAAGMQACGTSGVGRMSEPEEIVAALEVFLAQQGRWRGRKVLVTAGGTREPLDPVRYIGNAGSGKMGHALAEVFQESGAEVVLVTAAEREAPGGVKCVRVTTAEQMRSAVLADFADADVVVKTAAVADYRPVQAAEQKIKKTGGQEDDRLRVELVPNPDILAELGRMKEKQFLVGFAAETHDVLAHAEEKLRRKNVDMLVVNDVTQEGAGFGVDTNIVTVLCRDGSREDWPLMSKKELAERLADVVLERLQGD